MGVRVFGPRAVPRSQRPRRRNALAKWNGLHWVEAAPGQEVPRTLIRVTHPFWRAKVAGSTKLGSMSDTPHSADPTPGIILIIGYGSTLRGDDGVGPVVVERIEARALERVQVIACHQLTPELADPISRASRVVFVDASMDLADAPIRISRVEPAGQHQVMVHTASPAGLLDLARSVFGRVPEAWVVEVRVAEMGIGERLSAVAEQGVERA